MKEVINAFHKDYVKTYHPELLSAIRTESTQAENGKVNGAKSKVQRESVHGKTVNSIHAFPKTKPRLLKLEVRDLITFSRAGTANTTKVKKK